METEIDRVILPVKDYLEKLLAINTTLSVFQNTIENLVVEKQIYEGLPISKETMYRINVAIGHVTVALHGTKK